MELVETAKKPQKLNACGFGRALVSSPAKQLTQKPKNKAEVAAFKNGAKEEQKSARDNCTYADHSNDLTAYDEYYNSPPTMRKSKNRSWIKENSRTISCGVDKQIDN